MVSQAWYCPRLMSRVEVTFLNDVHQSSSKQQTRQRTSILLTQYRSQCVDIMIAEPSSQHTRNLSRNKIQSSQSSHLPSQCGRIINVRTLTLPVLWLLLEVNSYFPRKSGNTGGMMDNIVAREQNYWHKRKVTSTLVERYVFPKITSVVINHDVRSF